VGDAVSTGSDGSDVPILQQIVLLIAGIAAVCGGLLLLWFVLTVTAALAHGPSYAWIMNEPRYVDKIGIHCCSDDCKPVDAADLHELPDGILYLPTQEKLSYRTDEGRNGGIYPVAEPNPPDARRPWVCRRHDRLRCIFRVMPEG
jgi:hypothetical protein